MRVDRRKGGRWVLVVIGLLLLWPATAAAQDTIPARGLVLRNDLAVPLTIEVVPVADGQCAAESAALQRQALAPGRAWRLTSPSPLCWRRAGTGGGSPPGPWQQVTPPVDTQLTVRLD